MIYITGDTHGRQTRFSKEAMPYAEGWDKGDTLIVLGDFGFLSSGSTREELFLRELSFKPYTICFLDGHRENFRLLGELPVTQWCGGSVHRVRRNVIHLMRGQVYEMDGMRLFTMGGGYSVDRFRRDEGVDWWPCEMPSEAEYATARKNLINCGMKVDYVLSHTAPTSVAENICKPVSEELELCDFLEWVKQNVAHRQWYFGHFHMDAALDEGMYAMFTDVRDITTGVTLW